MEGTVKFFDAQKEFGFIIGKDGTEYFVHQSGLEEGVRIDKEDSVTFETEKGNRGMKAVKVSKV